MSLAFGDDILTIYRMYSGLCLI